jgi:hypothetical protein
VRAGRRPALITVRSRLLSAACERIAESARLNIASLATVKGAHDNRI